MAQRSTRRIAKRHSPDPNTGNRAAVYLRRSKSDEEGSIPVQDASCHAFAAARGWIVVAVETDMESAFAAGSEARPGYVRVLELARAGAIDHVVVWKWSRFGRDAGESLSRFKELRRLGVRLHSSTEDLENPLLAGILAVIAEHESSEMSHRIASVMRHKHAGGRFTSTPPFGTVLVDGRLLPGTEHPALVAMFELAAAGAGVFEITRRVNATYVLARPLIPSRTSRILRNPAYIGLLRGTLPDGRGTTAGTWEPLIERELFDRAGRSLERLRRVKRRFGEGDQFWFRGMVDCAVCGGAAYLRTQKTRRGGRYHPAAYFYVSCTHGCPRVHDRSDALAAYLAGELAPLRLGADDVPLIRRGVALFNERQARTPSAQRERLATERATLAARRERAEEGFLSGLLTAQRAATLKGDADRRIAQIDAELALLPQAAALDPEAVAALLVSGPWTDPDPDRYRAYAEILIERIRIGARAGSNRQPPAREIIWTPFGAALRALICQ